MSVSNIPQKIVNLLWGLAGGHCELCGKNVSVDYLLGEKGKFAEVAHIEADSPRGPRYNPSQTDDERNSVGNLMLLCPVCHKDIDSNPEEFSVGYLKARKRFYEDSVKEAVDAIGPACTDVVTLSMVVGSDRMSVSDKDWKKALVDAGISIGDAHAFDASEGVPDGCGPSSLRGLKKRITLYREAIHTDKARRTSVFAIAPQPVLIGLGSMLADDGSIDVYQKRRDADGWSWVADGQANEFHLKEKRSGSSEDCAIAVSVSGHIASDTFQNALPDEAMTLYELGAARTGSTAMMLKDDWHAFKHAVTEAVFEIHQAHPEAKRLHVIPAMPVSACVAFGMAWNRLLIPELVIYEKTDGKFERVLTIGGPNGFGD